MYEPVFAERRLLRAIGVGVLVAVGVLIAIAIVNNSWRIWDTAAFCGSYADFYDPPVPEVCLSFPTYLRLSITHPPYIFASILIGGSAAVLEYYRGRLSDRAE